MQLKTAKGTRDWAGNDIVRREDVFNKIRSVFKLHGGEEIDTPVFELKNVLTDKYGEDSKLIYDLQDQGGELCALRYDLTVPFARWLAMNKSVKQIKRFQIGKVYRRDQPAPGQGRMREFYQCDFDYAGSGFDPMAPDAEVLCLIVEIFQKIELNIKIRINHRCILDGIFVTAGVPTEKTRSISSAIDKLDKLPWPKVREEILQKGLAPEVAEILEKYFVQPPTVSSMTHALELLENNDLLAGNEEVRKGVDDMKLLGQYLAAYEVTEYITFDLTLARGLDYYTGLIYEVAAVSNGTSGKLNGIGSIAAGGRYDNLAGSLGGSQMPCVGVSFGIDRILATLSIQQEENNYSAQGRRVEVWLIASGGHTATLERMAIARKLREADISVDFSPKSDQKVRKQFDAAQSNASIAVFIEANIATSGMVRYKDLTTKTEKDIRREDLIGELSKLLE
jgi:histidyl-tRNA synthetase